MAVKPILRKLESARIHAEDLGLNVTAQRLSIMRMQLQHFHELPPEEQELKKPILQRRMDDTLRVMEKEMTTDIESIKGDYEWEAGLLSRITKFGIYAGSLALGGFILSRMHQEGVLNPQDLFFMPLLCVVSAKIVSFVTDKVLGGPFEKQLLSLERRVRQCSIAIDEMLGID